MSLAGAFWESSNLGTSQKSADSRWNKSLWNKQVSSEISIFRKKYWDPCCWFAPGVCVWGSNSSFNLCNILEIFPELQKGDFCLCKNVVAVNIFESMVYFQAKHVLRD